jgi:hypothetical protein
MSAPTHSDIEAAITARDGWAKKQAVWYQMRHEGLRRRNKPWPNAADMHAALADDTIEKLKPNFVAQIYATDTIANLVALKSDWSAYQAGAAQWFDHQLKQGSNFEEEADIAVDTMLERGVCPVKVTWDAERKRLHFEGIDPLYLIVPPWTDSVRDADWIVHVQRYSKEAYKRLPAAFRREPELLGRICGASDDPAASYEEERLRREGINVAGGKAEIVVWEVYFRDDKGAWRVQTMSPAAPGVALRPEFGLPYNRGVFEGDRPPPPFFSFRFETKQRGHYAARGVCERVAPEEASMSKDWNTIKDWQTLVCAPVFYAESGVPNGTNLRMIPGQILPFKLAAVPMPPIPADLPNQMLGTQRMAQERLSVPSVGVGRNVDPTKNKTAAETNLISSIMQASGDVRSRAFRRQLGEGLNLAWAIALQYRRETLDYYFHDELQALDAQALDGQYRIEASGSGDNSNRALVLQKAISRKQMFTGNPNINQRELDRSVLEADDPRLVKKLLLDQGTQQAEQIEDQAQEISIMLLGFPAQVKPSDDDMAHLTSLAGFTQRRAQTGEPLTAENLTAIAQHAQGHMEALKKKNPPVWAQRGQHLQMWLREVQGQAQALTQQAQQQQQAMAMMQAAQAGGQPGDAPLGDVVPMGDQQAAHASPDGLRRALAGASGGAA